MTEANSFLADTEVTAAVPAPATILHARARAQFRIIATTDLHMHVNAYDYYTDTACADKGLALAAPLIAKARAECACSILVDNGDFLQGSPMGDYVAGKGITPNPMIAAMNGLGYDAVNIGNHEFSHGLDYLSQALSQAKFPCLSANTFRANTQKKTPFLPPFSIVEKTVQDSLGQSHVIRIGVIGVLPPQTTVWDQQSIGGKLRIGGMVNAVEACLPKMRRQGADLVIALAHCSIGEAEACESAENAALNIARLDGIDAVVMGHAHLTFPGPAFLAAAQVDPSAGTLAGKPAVMPGAYGSHVGIIDLWLERGQGRWRITTHQSEARGVGPNIAPSYPNGIENAQIARLSAQSHAATLDWARKPIGRIGRTIHSYFAAVSDSATVALVNQAQAHYVRSQLAGSTYASLPVLSASAPYKAGGRGGPGNYSFCQSGEMLRRHAADLCVHPNTVVGLSLTGAEIVAWLEQSSRFFQQIRPGSTDAPLLNTEVPSFQFDTILGLTYTIDLAAAGVQAAQPRILDPRYQGQQIEPDQMFILATNSYRSSGSGGFFAPDPQRIVLAGQKTTREVLIDYVASGAATSFAPEPTWRFGPLADTTVTFSTTPLALSYLGDVAHLDLTPLSLGPDGFQTVRLAL